ncbi:MAG TPA: NAD(P)/FAD-dependent oxidoreductase [Candidatus Angelobacter sp.]|nr:NAD(P)/FAD-dependent oxidoreductase [Candidatus Angelobacter sp.]
MKIADVAIIGAGVAGLTAARELSGAGMHVLLLEGRDRIGGRIFTHHTSDYPVELGAEFIHGRPPEIFDLVKEGRLRVAEMKWKVARRKGNRWIENDQIMGAVEQLFFKISTDEPDQSFQQFIDRVDPNPEVKDQALRFVEGFHAADPRRISVHSLVKSNTADEKIDGDRQFRFEQGYDLLVKSISESINWKSCELRLNTPITEVEWKPGKVVLKTSTGAEFQAQRAIVTVPLGVLKAGSIRFNPALREKEKALQGLETGPVIRASLCLRSKFWEDQERFHDVSFLFTDDRQFPTWWTSNPLPFPILTGWAAGHYARTLINLSANQVVHRALESLARILDMDIARLERELQAGFTHDWEVDPFSCGAYSYPAVGGSNAGRELESPLCSTLFFAGEATDSEGHNGTVHGAIASGLRVANAVVSG